MWLQGRTRLLWCMRGAGRVWSSIRGCGWEQGRGCALAPGAAPCGPGAEAAGAWRRRGGAGRGSGAARGAGGRSRGVRGAPCVGGARLGRRRGRAGKCDRARDGAPRRAAQRVRDPGADRGWGHPRSSRSSELAGAPGGGRRAAGTVAYVLRAEALPGAVGQLQPARGSRRGVSGYPDSPRRGVSGRPGSAPAASRVPFVSDGGCALRPPANSLLAGGCVGDSL